MNIEKQTIISNIYTIKEGFHCVCPWFKRLKEQGLNPDYVVMDGERSVIMAIDSIWPHASIQRCLYHIQREGMRWLRTYPITAAGQELRRLLRSLCWIKTIKSVTNLLQTTNHG